MSTCQYVDVSTCRSVNMSHCSGVLFIINNLANESVYEFMYVIFCQKYFVRIFQLSPEFEPRSVQRHTYPANLNETFYIVTYSKVTSICHIAMMSESHNTKEYSRKPCPICTQGSYTRQTDEQSLERLIEPITTHPKGQGNPIRLSMVCNP